MQKMYDMIQDLSPRDVKVLLALQENPLGTYDKLASRAGFGKSVVYGILQNLSFNLDRDNVRQETYFNVVADLNLWNLGLEVVDVVIKAERDKLRYIEQLCFEHPYTIYRGRCFGTITGMLVQFRVPKNTSPLIQDLFQIIQYNDMIDQFSILPFAKAQAIYSTTNLDYWNDSSNIWAFDWTQWFNTEPEFNLSESPTGESGVIKKKLREIDVYMIKELTLNARRKNIDIMKALQRSGHQISYQTFKRRFRRVKEQCISGYRVFLSPRILEQYISIIICGSGDKMELELLKARMISNPIPFPSTLKVVDNQLFWYLVLPPQYLSKLFINLEVLLTDIHFDYIDSSRSVSYTLWPAIFDEQKSDWRMGREFMVDNILEKLKIH